MVDMVKKSGSDIRWTPHQRVPVDMLTKVDIAKGNGALIHLLKSGALRLDKEDEELALRQADRAERSRTRKATERLLEDEGSEYRCLLTGLINIE